MQIETPLDFLVVSDHAEVLGVMTELHSDRSLLADMGFWGNFKRWVSLEIADYLIDSGRAELLFTYGLPKPPVGSGHDPVADENGAVLDAGFGDTTAIRGHVWEDIVGAAERHNRPGTFTSLIGWEWTSTPTGANLHRVILTPDGAEKASQFLPYGSDESQYPQDLWRWLEKTGERTGTRFLSIPHNSNLSKGYMFDDLTLEEILSPLSTHPRAWRLSQLLKSLKLRVTANLFQIVQQMILRILKPINIICRLMEQIISRRRVIMCAPP